MPGATGPAIAGTVIPPITWTRFVDENGILTAAGLNILQQIWAALFGGGTGNITPGSSGSATTAVTITYNAGGLLTAVSEVMITPDISSITGLGSGVATALEHGAGAPGGFAITAGASAFSANLNAVDQTGVVSATPTLVGFDTVIYNIGAYFSTASNEWVPPVGTVAMTASVEFSGTITAASAAYIAIYKNNAELYRCSVPPAAANAGGMSITCEDRANGTDFYQVFAFVTTSSGAVTISGTNTKTFFQGHWIGP